MSAHTPGPWGGVTDEFGLCKRAIAYPEGDDRDHDLCVVQCGDPDELEANARLIAAAPDLLAACEEALEFAEDQEDVVDGDYGEQKPNRAMQLASMLRAAIAKAERQS